MFCTTAIKTRLKSTFIVSSSGVGYKLGTVSNLTTFGGLLSEGFVLGWREGFPITWTSWLAGEFQRLQSLSTDRQKLGTINIPSGLYNTKPNIYENENSDPSLATNMPSSPKAASPFKRPISSPKQHISSGPRTPPSQKMTSDDARSPYSPLSIDPLTRSGRRVVSPRPFWDNRFTRLSESASPFPKRRWAEWGWPRLDFVFIFTGSKFEIELSAYWKMRLRIHAYPYSCLYK